MKFIPSPVAVLLVVAALAAGPCASFAAAAEPEAIDDPVGAIAPAQDPAPVAEAEGAAVPEAAQSGVVEVAAANEPAAGSTPRAGAATAPTRFAPSTAAVGSGALPFTGTVSWRLVLLLVVGSLLMCAGVVARLVVPAPERAR